jgi:hypothetical protein
MVFTEKGCLRYSNSSKVNPRAQISKAFPLVHFSFYVPMISSGAA